MRTIAILVALVAITSIAAAQDTATNDEPRILQLIQLKYLDVGTAIRLFGGNIIPTAGYTGYQARPRGRRGGYSHARTGSQVGGSFTTPRTYNYQPRNGSERRPTAATEANGGFGQRQRPMSVGLEAPTYH